MERIGLVSQVEAELEQMLSRELLPANGMLPSEYSLARCFGVSRGTVREALLRLSAKGMVEQRPGRKTRAVPLDEAVTLENLSVVLDGDGRLQPGRRRLLEGYLALKRDVTVELLATCCAGASAAYLDELGQACYALRDAARWATEGGSWARQEFELLRLAALAADRPGHMLLIQSLERSFRGMAKWMQPHLDAEATQSWALCAMNALAERDLPALKTRLPALLQAGDDRLLLRLAPPSQIPERSAARRAHSEPTPSTPPSPEATRGEVPEEVAPTQSDCRTALCQLPPTGASSSGPVSSGASHEPASAEPGQGSPQAPEESRRSRTPPLPDSEERWRPRTPPLPDSEEHWLPRTSPLPDSEEHWLPRTAPLPDPEEHWRPSTAPPLDSEDNGRARADPPAVQPGESHMATAHPCMLPCCRSG